MRESLVPFSQPWPCMVDKDEFVLVSRPLYRSVDDQVESRDSLQVVVHFIYSTIRRPESASSNLQGKQQQYPTSDNPLKFDINVELHAVGNIKSCCKRMGDA